MNNRAGARAMAVLNVAGLVLAAGCFVVGDVPLALFCSIIHTVSLAIAATSRGGEAERQPRPAARRRRPFLPPGRPGRYDVPPTPSKESTT